MQEGLAVFLQGVSGPPVAIDTRVIKLRLHKTIFSAHACALQKSDQSVSEYAPHGLLHSHTTGPVFRVREQESENQAHPCRDRDVVVELG